MSKWHASAVAVTIAAVVAVPASQAAHPGTKRAPLFTAQQIGPDNGLYAGSVRGGMAAP